jgi:hypothetical protein
MNSKQNSSAFDTYTMPNNLFSFVWPDGREIVCVSGKCRARAIRAELDASGSSDFQTLRTLAYALRAKYPRGYRG